MTRLVASLRARWHLVAMFAISYLPVITLRPGEVSADTKTYLFLDPSELMREASSVWTSAVGAGTVTHQTIGYLWPMGPYFWLCEAIGIPDWLAQRLWWGSLVFLAMLGAWRLSRHLGTPTAGAMVTALFYGLSPYTLSYIARLSGILLPWVGLPWLIWCLMRRREEPGWRWTARAALVIGTVGTVNATTLLFAIVGVAVWLTADAMTGLSTWRQSCRSLLAIGVSSVMVSAWWLASLAVQSRYGLPILRYSETYDAVAKASLPQELMRGLGYWYFYGGDESGRWIGPSASYTTRPVVLTAGFLLAAIGLVAVAIGRHRHRVHLALLVLVGMGLATGAAPLGDSTLYGALFERIVSHESGFALRSTARALPLVILAFALATGFLVHTVANFLQQRLERPDAAPPPARLTSVVAIAIAGVVMVNNFPWFTHRLMTDAIARDENIPAYWMEAASTIDAERDPANGFGRTFEFPASNFADHWWGGTVDPILPGLLRSEYVSKEMIPQGSEPTTDLMSAFESRLVDGRPDIGSVGALAALMAANTVTWRADLAYDHYLTARPEYLAPALAASPPGETLFVGPVIDAATRLSIVDESHYANTAASRYPLAQVWRVADPRPLLSVAPLDRVTTLVGSGEGLLEALSTGVVDATDTIIYAGTHAHARRDGHPHFPAMLRDRRITHLVVTDTNRKAARQWSSIAQQTGRTEQADEDIKRDSTDQRLNPFTDDYRARVAVEQMTTSRMTGDVRRVVASSYGHPVVLTPEARPENVVDRDNRTSWVVGVRGKAVGEWIRIDYVRPMASDSVVLDLSQREPGDRFLEEARFDFLDATGRTVASRTVDVARRATVSFDTRGTSFSSLKMTVTRESASDLVDFAYAPGIAINDITVGTAIGEEYIVVPRVSADFIGRADDVSIVLRRQFIDPSIPHRRDTERNIQRIIEMPTAATMTMSGTAHLSGRATEGTLAGLTGLTMASSTTHLPGSARSIASRAIDGDAATAWTTPLDAAIGATLETSIRPTGAGRTLRFTWGAPGLSSTPTLVTVIDDQGVEHRLALETESNEARAELPDDFRFPVRAVRIDDVAPETFPNYFTKQIRQLPVVVAEIDFGTPNPRRIGRLDERCRDDLVEVNSLPVSVRVLNTPDIFDTNTPLPIQACEPVRLRAGENTIRTAVGLDVGLDINGLVLGTRSPDGLGGDRASTAVTVTSLSQDHLTATITVDSPQVLSFAQSINHGWRAHLRTPDGRTIVLGDPFVVQGHANGWLVPESGELTLRWAPQRTINMALWFSGLSALGVSWLALRRRTPTSQIPSPNPAPSELPWVWVWVVGVGLFAVAGIVPAAVALLVARFVRRLVPVVVVGAITVVAATIVVQQLRLGEPAPMDWPLRFAHMAPWAWLAVAVATINPVLRRD